MASNSPHQPSFTPIQQTQVSPPSGLQASPPNTGPSDAKRRRITRACDLCKSRKRRCTGDVPCLSCIGSAAKCTYLTSYNRGKTTFPPTSGLSGQAGPSGSGFESGNSAVGQTNGSQVSKWLDVVSAANGTQVTRADRQTTILEESRSGSPGATGQVLDGQYLGPSSPYAFIRRACRRLSPSNTGSTGLDMIYKSGLRFDESVPILQHGDRQPAGHKFSQPFPDAQNMRSLVKRYFEFASPTYRYLHEPTVCEWRERLQQEEEDYDARTAARTASLPGRCAAVVWLTAAIALSSVPEGAYEDEVNDTDAASIGSLLLETAEQLLREEEGRPTLESVQARLAQCQYLLCISRPGEAWYTLGTATQMMMAIGLHRRGTTPGGRKNTITRECSKRVFWSAYLLDAYLSGMLGRPHLIHDDDIDQELPTAVDDEQLTADGLDKKPPQKECSTAAAVMHAKLAVIIKRASREQTSITKSSDTSKVENAARLATQLAEWQKSLPLILSGAVHPSTLVPFFRRQVTILRIAKAHASMLIHRFAILSDPKQLPGIEMHIDECLNAALTCLDMIVEMAAENHMFAAFWNTHFVTFGALTIVYVWLIQRRIGRLPLSEAVPDTDDLAKQAEIVRMHLHRATNCNAPSLRYNMILEELSHEAQRCTEKVPADRQAEKGSEPEQRFDPSGSLLAGMDDQQPPEAGLPTPLDLDAVFDFPIDSDLWIQLDTFPFGE